MNRKHAHRSNAKQVKSMLTTTRNNFIPDCFVHDNAPKPYTVIKSDKKEPLVDEHETTSEIQQTVINDLRNELSETRIALDAVTLDRNQYKRIKELAECKLWDEQDKKDDLQAQIKELTDANLELTQKVQHLVVQNENLNKLLNHNSDNTAEELQLPKAEVRYIVFERTNLSKCIKATCLDTVIYYVKCGNTYAYTYDRVKSQLEKADVAMFHDHFIVKL